MSLKQSPCQVRAIANSLSKPCLGESIGASLASCPISEQTVPPFDPVFGHHQTVTLVLTTGHGCRYTFILGFAGGTTIGSILIVDDNTRLAESLKRNFQLKNHQCTIAADARSALQRIDENSFDLMLLDIRLQGESGLDVLDHVHNRGYDIPVVIITGNATIESAIGAIRKRVIDYIRKPIDFDELYTICAPHIAPTSGEIAYQVTHKSSAIQTVNSEFRRVIAAASKLAKAEIPIFITGESGTGKELLADYIHQESSRGLCPMYKVNCASLPESLLESELFGHTRGAFTGATEATAGIFQKANGSSLFLDEIGDMPVGHQAKILRVLHNKEIRPVGGSEVIHVDVRFIAATNKSIEHELASGTFREDLYYRLNAGHFHIPPLRERPEDIPVLADHFARAIGDVHGYRLKEFSDDAMQAFLLYRWPGNVRELKNVVQYAFAVSEGDTIRIEDLPGSQITAMRSARRSGEPTVIPPGRSDQGIRSLDETERDLIKRTLITTRNNKKETARILRISRSTLYEKIKKFGLENESYKPVNPA